jgi:hypothetical protein
LYALLDVEAINNAKNILSSVMDVNLMHNNCHSKITMALIDIKIIQSPASCPFS